MKVVTCKVVAAVVPVSIGLIVFIFALKSVATLIQAQRKSRPTVDDMRQFGIEIIEMIAQRELVFIV